MIAWTRQHVKICIPGEPIPQARPRATSRGGKARVYEPEGRSKKYKNKIRATILEATGRTPTQAGFNALPYPPKVPLQVTIRAYHSCPKSDERVRTPAPQRWRVSTPDIDNIAKGVLDACTGYLWHDDAQVVRLVAEHYTAAQGDKPCLIIEVTHISEASIRTLIVSPGIEQTQQ